MWRSPDPGQSPWALKAFPTRSGRLASGTGGREELWDRPPIRPWFTRGQEHTQPAEDALVPRVLALIEIQCATGAQGNRPGFLPPPHPTLYSVGIRRAWSGAAALSWWQWKGSSECLALAHGTLTYVFVQELALVPVVQVDELGSTLLLPVHPAADVLAACLCIEVGALPMPGEDKTRAPGYCPLWEHRP